MEKQPTEYKPFKNTVQYRDGTKAWATIDIEYTHDGRLSISGDCRKTGRYAEGSSGQCQDTMLEWFPESKRLYDLWERWHLNDMHAGCEHQRAEWDVSEDVELYTHTLDSETLGAKNAAESRAAEALKKGERVQYTKAELALVNSRYSITSDNALPPHGYKQSKCETKKAGWLRYDEHPKGLLSKPCGTCGYKYGSKWLYEAVPAEVLAELEAMR